MPRQARKESGTGIFHVMMRDINHQNIFPLETHVIPVMAQLMTASMFIYIENHKDPI
jgi:hypothetical protein